MKSGFAPPPPVKKPQDDIFAIEGFSRIDHLDMPKGSGLSASTFKEIFPPLREPILRRAAVLHFRHRMTIDDAVIRAIDEIDLQQLLYGEGLRSEVFRALMPCFPDRGLTGGFPSREILRFTNAVEVGAGRWRQILSADNPLAEAWFAAAIEPEDGRCVISGRPLIEWSLENPDSYALPEYAANFHEAGSMLCGVILERAREIGEARRKRPPVYPPLDPAINPDDPQTYMEDEGPEAFPAANSEPFRTAPQFELPPQTGMKRPA